MSGEPHPKPASRPRKQIRIIDGRVTRHALFREPVCPVCKAARSETVHHILGRGSPHFGDDVYGNLVALCGHGTRGCHGLIENSDDAARRSLGAYLAASRPDSMVYLSERLGGPVAAQAWLQRHLHVQVEISA